MTKMDELRKWKTLKTEGFTKIYDLCEMAYDYSIFYAIVCESGGGKSFTFKCFQEEFPNVYLIKLTKFWSAKVLMVRLLQQVGVYDYSEYFSLDILSQKFIETIRKQRKKCLFIFDEAGKLTADMMEFFQPLRDETENNMGIILAGTSKFKEKMDKWKEKKELGIPELYTRITSWEKIPLPGRKERYQMAKQNGITNLDLLNEIADDSTNFRDVFKKVIEYRAIVLKQQSKHTTSEETEHQAEPEPELVA